jgi:chromosome segregation ATPase
MDQELVQYLDERFGRIEQRLDGHDRRFDSINQRFDRVEQRLNDHDQRFDEVKRHTGVLVEGLRSQLQLAAEGLLTHIDVRHAEDRTYVDQRFQETNALIRIVHESNKHLRHRVESLERQRPN